MPFPVVFSAAMVVFCIGAFVYFRAYINKRTSRDAVLAEIREEINRLLIRMDETTNRDITLIEDKEQSLRALLEETEKRLTVYTREMERSLVNEKRYREIGSARRNSSEIAKPQEEAPAPSSVDKIPPASEETKTPQNSPANSPEPAQKAAVSLGEQIRQLGALGFGPSVIASKLGISITEVELALAVLSPARFSPLDRAGLS